MYHMQNTCHLPQAAPTGHAKAACTNHNSSGAIASQLKLISFTLATLSCDQGMHKPELAPVHNKGKAFEEIHLVHVHAGLHISRHTLNYKR